MKNLFNIICILGMMSPLKGIASLAINTNDVAVAILAYASMDNDDDLDVDTEYPVRYSDWNGLLDAVAVPGLTREDKDRVLTAYLMTQSTNNLSLCDAEMRELIRIGLCECRDLNHTNVLPIIRNFFVNPTAHYMDEPVCLFYKWSELDQDYLEATRLFLSNTSSDARKNKPTDALHFKKLSWKSVEEANRIRACIEKEDGEAFFAANGHAGMIKKGYTDINFPYKSTGRIWRIK